MSNTLPSAPNVTIPLLTTSPPLSNFNLPASVISVTLSISKVAKSKSCVAVWLPRLSADPPS